ncbi:MAG: DUF2460 domain-containing protein [Rhodospirillales bacterium]|nr:DUF2460 domain-containing protein [Rhodospirillales bacterium]
MTSFAEVRFPPEISYGATAGPEFSTTVITADFEFDVPARFDTDRLEFRLETHDLMVWEQIPIIEVRP